VRYRRIPNISINVSVVTKGFLLKENPPLSEMRSQQFSEHLYILG